MKVLLIRPRGPHTTARLAGCSITETSLEQLLIKPSALSTLTVGETLGTVILEDLHRFDVPERVWERLRPAMAGSSCPVVSRWTNPDPNA